MDLAIAGADEQARDFCRAYQEREGITQMEHARRLGITQSALSDFCGTAPKRGLTRIVARALAAYHPDIRPIIQAWVNERIFDSPTGAPESPAACEQGSA